MKASAIPREQLGSILADYLALDRLRSLRRRLVIRYGLLAVVADIVGAVYQERLGFARWLIAAVFLILPLRAWVSELRLERRLSRRLDGGGAAVTYKPATAWQDLERSGIRKS